MLKSTLLSAVMLVGITSDVFAENTQKSGAPVLFKYGKGINKEEVLSIVRGMTEKGCPAKAVDGHRPRRVSAVTLGKTHSFKSPLAAFGWALDHCMTVSTWPVTLEFGPEVDTELVNATARVLSEQGCPTTVSNTGIPLTVTAQVNGRTHMFDDATVAGGWALKLCRK